MSDQGWIVRGEERVSVDPGDGDPLSGGGHQVHGLLQQANGVVNLVVDDGLVKVMSVGPLQHLGFLLESLERVVLREKKQALVSVSATVGIFLLS